MRSTWAWATSSSALAALLALALAVVAVPRTPGAKVFYSRSEALEIAFPEADRIEADTFVLADDQVSQIETLAGAGGQRSSNRTRFDEREHRAGHGGRKQCPPHVKRGKCQWRQATRHRRQV